MAGRPSSYDPSYCETAISFLADGYSLAALAGEIGIARSTIYEWADSFPEFSDAVKIGQAKAVLWWERENRKLATGASEGNATSVIFGLKNRAPDEWKDKRDVEVSGGLTATMGDLDDKL